MFVEGKLICIFCNKKFLLKFNSCLSCTDVSWKEVILKYYMNAFMRREVYFPVGIVIKRFVPMRI